MRGLGLGAVRTRAERRGEAGRSLRRSRAHRRIHFEPDCSPGSFGDLTDRILEAAQAVGEPYAEVLGLLADCGEAFDGRPFWAQTRGAPYDLLDDLARRSGMTGPQRARWRTICRELGLSERHARHIIGRLVGRRAA